MEELATVASSRSISLLTFLPPGDEQKLQTKHQDILNKISIQQTMVRLATTEHERETTENQVRTFYFPKQAKP